MDADGFTLVTRKKGGAAAASSVLPGLSASEESDNAKLKRKRGSLVRADFYAFQGRDNKLDRELDSFFYSICNVVILHCVVLRPGRATKAF